MARKKQTRDSTERRSRQRFRIGQSLTYRSLSGKRAQGVGKILDISSKGVRFTTNDMLTPGLRVELDVNWPTRLNAACLIKLMVYGCVVRSDTGAAAIKIEHYEFRTRAVSSLPAPPNPLDCSKGF